MAMINIPSTCSDPHYRYKMPRIISQKESSGNGKKTRIVNMGDVAFALKRPPQYITKWFGTELGAVNSYTCKQGEGERATLNGNYDAQTLQALLDKFIEKYVCCTNCHLPEIDMFVKKGNIQAKCAACGWAGDLDSSHRLATYIIKNPPDETGMSIVNTAEVGKGGKLDKKARRELKARLREKRAEGSTEGSAEGSAEGSDDDDDDDGSAASSTNKDRKDKKGKKEKKAKHKKEKRPDEEEGEDGEEREKKDKKQKKEKKKKEKKEKKEKRDKKEKEKKEKGTNETNDKKEKEKEKEKEEEKNDDLTFDDEETKAIISILRSFFDSHASKTPVDDFVEELRMQQLAKGFDRRVGFYIALEALCGERMDMKAAVEKRKYISKVIASAKMDTQDVLWALGAYIEANPDTIKGFARVLKTCYDEDWADEKDILSYYEEDNSANHPGYSQAKKAAVPFLQWLKEAESEEEDDEEGQEDSN